MEALNENSIRFFIHAYRSHHLAGFSFVVTFGWSYFLTGNWFLSVRSRTWASHNKGGLVNFGALTSVKALFY